MLRIIDGERPLKPNFVITRGYTEDLWEITTRCWNQDPFQRPTVDRVLDGLKVAAEQWKPRLPSSPQDDLSPTLWAEESDSHTFSEPEDEHVSTDPSLPPDSPRSPVIKTPVTATPSLPALSPWTAKVETPFEYIPATFDEEKIQTGPIDSFQEDPRQNPVLKEDVESMPATRPSQEELGSTPAAVSEGWIQPVPVESSGKEEPKPIPAAVGKEKMEVDSIGLSKEENPGRLAPVEQVPVTSEEEGTQQASTSLPETRPGGSTPPASRGDEIEETAQVALDPVIPKKAGPAPTASPKPSSETTLAGFIDRNRTLSVNGSNLTTLPDLEDQRTTAVSNPFNLPSSFATKAPVPILSTPTPSPLLSSSSTTEGGTPSAPKLSPTTSREEPVDPVVPRPPGKEGFRPTPTVEGKGEIPSAYVRSPREDEHKQISVTTKEGETKPVPVTPPREKGSKPIPATSANDKTQQAPASPSTRLELGATFSEKGKTKPVKPNSLGPMEVNLQPKPTPTPSLSQAVKTGPTNVRREELSSKPTHFPISGEEGESKEMSSEPTPAVHSQSGRAEPSANSSTRAEVQFNLPLSREVPDPLFYAHSRELKPKGEPAGDKHHPLP